MQMKSTGEVALVGEAYRYRYFGQRQFALFDQILGSLNPTALLVGHWAYSDRALEEPREVKPAHLCDSRKIVERDRAADILFNVADDSR
jgi:hypothetical protein